MISSEAQYNIPTPLPEHPTQLNHRVSNEGDGSVDSHKMQMQKMNQDVRAMHEAFEKVNIARGQKSQSNTRQ